MRLIYGSLFWVCLVGGAIWTGDDSARAMHDGIAMAIAAFGFGALWLCRVDDERGAG